MSLVGSEAPTEHAQTRRESCAYLWLLLLSLWGRKEDVRGVSNLVNFDGLWYVLYDDLFIALLIWPF